MTRLERREWDASRSRTDSPWSASRRRLRESRWDAARLRRSPIVDRAAGAASGEAAAGEAIGDGEPLVLGFSGEREGERKLRSAAGDGGVPPADGEEPPESREAGLGVPLGFGAALAPALGLAFGLGAASAALAFLMAAAAGVGVGGRRNLKFELAVVEGKREGPGFIIYVKNTQRPREHVTDSWGPENRESHPRRSK